MKISDYRGFQIQVYNKRDHFYAEVYRKEKLIHTIQDSGEPGEYLRSNLIALESAKDWIDYTYPKDKIRYFGGDIITSGITTSAVWGSAVDCLMGADNAKKSVYSVT